MRLRRVATLVVALLLIPVLSAAKDVRGDKEVATAPGLGLGSGTPIPVSVDHQMLRSDTSSLRGLVARETTGPDTFAIYGGPERPHEGHFEDPDTGEPSWNGWITVDETDHPVFWHVDTFNAENLNGHGRRNHAMWSGQSAADQPDWVTAPGYGNLWIDRLLYESPPLANAEVGQSVALDFVFNYDTEPGYDYFIVEFDSAGTWMEVCRVSGTNRDGADGFPEPGVRLSDVATRPISFAGGDYGGEFGDQIRIRLVVETDGGWSDEDGLAPSVAGAVQLDDISLATSQGTWLEDFEGPGPYLFVPERTPFVGDFADLFSWISDIDACRDDRSSVLGFIDYGQDLRNGPGVNGDSSTGGSTSANAYGIPGHWVTNFTGGLTFGARSLLNYAYSPDINWDLPGPEDDGPEFVGGFVRFDVWNHLPLVQGIFFSWYVRYAAPGESYEQWRNHPNPLDWWAYYGDQPMWLTRQHSITRIVPPGTERIQVALAVLDYADYFPWAHGNSGTPSPFFDNVAVYKHRLAGPVIEGDPGDLPHDSFARTGAADVSTPAARDLLDVPFDKPQSINDSGLLLTPGDSLVVTVEAVLPNTSLVDLRLFWTLRKNSLFEDALRAPPNGPRHLNVDASDPVIWSGEVIADTCRTSFGAVVTDRFFFDLPDVDFIYPGDVLQYYLRTEDSGGRVVTVPSDLTGYGLFDDSYPRYGSIRALPSYLDADGAHPPLLIINDAGHEGYYPALTQSLRELGMTEGVDYDMYWRRSPRLAQNSIGSSGSHGATLQQIAGYSSILYMAGIVYHGLLSDGSNVQGNRKANDLDLLYQWRALPGRRNIAYFGDQLAWFMSRESDRAAFLQEAMGVEYVVDDVIPAIGGQVNPVLEALHPGFSATIAVTYACQLDPAREGNPRLIPHNHVLPGPTSVYGHRYIDPAAPLPTGVPAASSVQINPNPGVTGYDVFFPFAFGWIRDPAQRAVGAPARTLLLQELLTLFEEPIPGGGVVTAPERRTLALTATPNPFNPRTTIAFDVALGQKGAVRVYNLRGELVKVVHDGEYDRREFAWDGTDEAGNAVASGVYVVRASADGESRARKIALVR